MVMRVLWSVLAFLDRIGFWGRRFAESAVVCLGIVVAVSLVADEPVIDSRRAAGVLAGFFLLYPLLVAWLWSDDR